MTSATFTFPIPATWKRNGLLRSVAAGCALAVFTAGALSGAGASWDLFFFLLASAIFFGALCLVRPLSSKTLAVERETFLSATLVIWIFLMVSEAVFVHLQTSGSAVGGHFDPSAYFQAASWILSFLALALISCFRPCYLRRLLGGPLKWANIFAVVAVLSCFLSPVPAYSLALAFKLCVIVLVLGAMGEGIEDEEGVSKVFGALFVGLLIVVTAEAMAPFLRPGPLFQAGRLGMMIGLSGTCGMLLILSLLFLWLKKNPWFLLCAICSVAVMMLAGTKGGMVASFASLLMFFFLLKRPAQALAVSLVFGIIFAFFVAFTPLGQSLQHYSESGNAASLTGRTGLWTATWPSIESHILFGHGYRASRFVSEEVEGAFAEAGNMHNSFLEVLYNNGLAGLLPILAINILIVCNLRKVIVRPLHLRLRYYAAAAFALQIHLVVWGLVSATFGGAPDNRFMTLFALLLISMFLRGQCDKTYWNAVYGERIS